MTPQIWMLSFRRFCTVLGQLVGIYSLLYTCMCYFHSVRIGSGSLSCTHLKGLSTPLNILFLLYMYWHYILLPACFLWFLMVLRISVRQHILSGLTISIQLVQQTCHSSLPWPSAYHFQILLVHRPESYV